MRKNLALLASLTLALLIAVASIGPTQATIADWKWLDPTFSGFDGFYAAVVTAYREGATANLVVIANRDLAPVTAQVNITDIEVVFDWGGNYTVIATPAFTLNDTVPTASFILSFIVPPATVFNVPSATVASNLFLHSYTIYVKYVTTAGKNTFTSGAQDSFAVYSTDQADAQVLKQTAVGYAKPGGGFTSADANILWTKGDTQLNMGDTAYMLGNFAGAKTNYQNAITFYEQAYTAEATYTQDYRNAQTSYYNAITNQTNVQTSVALKDAVSRSTEANASATQADAAMKQATAAQESADAALTNAYGWMELGIGWMLVGIGVIIYGIRKPKSAAA